MKKTMILSAALISISISDLQAKNYFCPAPGSISIVTDRTKGDFLRASAKTVEGLLFRGHLFSETTDGRKLDPNGFKFISLDKVSIVKIDGAPGYTIACFYTLTNDQYQGEFSVNLNAKQSFKSCTVNNEESAANPIKTYLCTPGEYKPENCPTINCIQG